MIGDNLDVAAKALCLPEYRRWLPARVPAATTRVRGAAAGGQPAADGTHGGDGDVEGGTTGHPRTSLRAGFPGREQL